MARQKVHPDSVERTVTVFGACVPATTLLSKPALLLVHNIPDPVNLSLTCHRIDPNQNNGKKAGWGKPGGGMKADEWENASTAAIGEFSRETGLEVAQAIELPEFEDPRIITTEICRICREPRGKPRIAPFKKGKRPSIPYDPRNEEQRENCISLFKVKAAWKGSALDRILTELKASLLASGKYTQEDLDHSGIGVWFGHLDPRDPRVMSLMAETNERGKPRLTIERIDELNRMRGLPGHRDLAGMSTDDIDDLCRKKGLLTSKEQAALNIEEIDEIDAIWLYPFQALEEEFTQMQSGHSEHGEFYFRHLERLTKIVRSGVFPELLST